VKNNKAMLVAVMMVTIILSAGLTAEEIGTPEYVPGELIVKLEHGVIDWQGFEETPIAHVSIRHPQLEPALVEYGVRSIERLFKSIFARPPFRFVN
jgi:hypothetical protein